MNIQQVARYAGVSTATVSRVINGAEKVRDATAKRVLRAIEELQYIPNDSARNLRVGRSRLFGLIISDIKNPFFPELIDEFEEQAARCGIDLVFTHTNYEIGRLDKCVKRLVERNVDGIAMMTSEISERSLEIASRGKTPLVLLNQPSLVNRFPTVLVDYSLGYQEAVSHLTELGHRRIAFIAGPPELSSAQRRHRAFLNAVRRCRLKLREEWTVSSDLTVESGYEAMQRLLRLKPRPTAVIATNDLTAVGALQAAQRAEISVPREISIVGFDDLPVAAMVQPQLTTIHLSRREIAVRAFKILMNLLEKKRTSGGVQAKISPRLVIRSSTARALSS